MNNTLTLVAFCLGLAMGAVGFSQSSLSSERKSLPPALAAPIDIAHSAVLAFRVQIKEQSYYALAIGSDKRSAPVFLDECVILPDFEALSTTLHELKEAQFSPLNPSYKPEITPTLVMQKKGLRSYLSGDVIFEELSEVERLRLLLITSWAEPSNH